MLYMKVVKSPSMKKDKMMQTRMYTEAIVTRIARTSISALLT